MKKLYVVNEKIWLTPDGVVHHQCTFHQGEAVASLDCACYSDRVEGYLVPQGSRHYAALELGRGERWDFYYPPFLRKAIQDRLQGSPNFLQLEKWGKDENGAVAYDGSSPQLVSEFLGQ